MASKLPMPRAMRLRLDIMVQQVADVRRRATEASAPQNLHSLSLAQLKGVCAAHGQRAR